MTDASSEGEEEGEMPIICMSSISSGIQNSSFSFKKREETKTFEGLFLFSCRRINGAVVRGF